MLDGARGGAADRGRHAGGAVRRHDDARRPRSFGAPDHGAQVARIRDLIEAGEKRALDRCELVRIGVAIGLAPRDHALVVARLGRFADLAVRLDVDARDVA